MPLDEIKIPQYFLNRIIEEMGPRCEKLMHKIKINDPRSFIEEIITSAFSLTNVNEVRRLTYKASQHTKKRWAESFIKSLSSNSQKKTGIQKELDVMANYIELYGEKMFRETHGVNSLEELVEKRKQEIIEWSNDKNSRLTDYIYIFDKTPTQIKKAIRSDVIVTVANILLQDYKGNWNNIIAENPVIYTDNPITSDGWGSLKLTNQRVVYDNKMHFVSEYKPDEDYTFLTLVNEDIAHDKSLLRTLDETDAKIFLAVMAEKDMEKFLEERRIVVDIRRIVLNVYGSDSIKNYNSVKRRLQKMANVRFNVVTPNRTLVFGIFEVLDIIKDETGEYADITVNGVVHRNIVEGNVVRAYSDKLNRLTGKISYGLIFPLQKERFLCYFRKTDYKGVYDYKFFTRRIHFRSKNKERNIEIIEESLKEFVEQGVTVKSYTRKNDVFFIEFLPVEPYEVQDLLHGQDAVHIISSPEQLSLPL